MPGAEAATNRAPKSPTCEGEFRQSRWFKRGWTLQELLAPRSVSFYAGDWTVGWPDHRLALVVFPELVVSGASTPPQHPNHSLEGGRVT